MKAKCFFTIVVLTVLGISVAPATPFIFQTTSGAQDSVGDPVSAQAIFTPGAGTLNITLANLLVGQKDVGQNVSDLFFTFGSSALNSGSISSSFANYVSVDGIKVPTSSGSGSTLWVLSYSSSTGFHLNGLGTPWPQSAGTIIGAPSADGKYDNANSSIAGNGPHNPFLDQTATFNLTIAGLTADTVITSATFSFGTDAGDNVPGTLTNRTSVPDSGATVMMLGMALSGLGMMARRFKK